MTNEYSKDRSDDIYSKVVKAGKRTYFFDVKATRGNDLFLTITESLKSFEGGKESYKKHKIFLYKEDFEKFQHGFEEVLKKIKELQDQDGTYKSSYESQLQDFDFDSL